MILRATLVCAAKALRPPNIGGDWNNAAVQEQLKNIFLDPRQMDEMRACGRALAQGQQCTRLAFASITAWATFLAMERETCGGDPTTPSFCVQLPRIKLYPVPWTGDMDDAKRRERIADATRGMSSADRALIIVDASFFLSFLTSLDASPEDFALALQHYTFDITIEGTVIQYVPRT